MTRHSLPLAASIRLFWRRHHVIILVLGFLAGASLSSRMALLPASVLPPLPTEIPEENKDMPSPFDPEEYPEVAEMQGLFDTFKTNVQAVFREREKILRSPSEWECDATSIDDMIPDSPKLDQMAARLPAWAGRPVTFSSFSAIVLAYQQAYEEELLDRQSNAERIVFQDGTDRSPAAPAESFLDFTRVRELREKIEQEQKRSRLALDRAFLLLRSFELASPLTVEMYCLERESADLRIALSLLSDTASCLPRAWDPSTSLHERDGE